MSFNSERKFLANIDEVEFDVQRTINFFFSLWTEKFVLFRTWSTFVFSLLFVFVYKREIFTKSNGYQSFSLETKLNELSPELSHKWTFLFFDRNTYTSVRNTCHIQPTTFRLGVRRKETAIFCALQKVVKKYIIQ